MGDVMSELNQYELSRSLGSKMRPVQSPRFGNMSLLDTTAEVLKASEELRARDADETRFGYEDDRVVVQAFEDVRDGASTDALLWERSLLSRFTAQCRKLGLDAPPKLLNRRLINVRKNKVRYAKHGIVLSPTSRKETYCGIPSQYEPAIEFALVRHRYRYGASIDDILIDVELCDEYENLVRTIVPSLTGDEIRRAALTLRKSRFIKRKEKNELQQLNIVEFRQELSQPVTLDKLDPETIPDEDGLIEIDEPRRPLYITRIANLRLGAHQFVEHCPFKIVDDRIWNPDANVITLRYIAGKTVAGVGIKKWASRLILDLHPVFNWPLHGNADLVA